MKKILLLLVVSFFMSNVNSQVIFSHDFEDETLGGMTIVDVDGKTPATNVAAYVDAWNVFNNLEADANFYAASNSWYAPAGQADDWIITPALDISEGGFLLEFDIRAQDANYPDGYEVLVSTTDNEIASFTDVIYSKGQESIEWQKVQVSLDDYAGETVYVAIRNNSNDMFILLMDNISVYKLAQFDVSAVSVGFDRWQLVGNNQPLSFEVKNSGSEILTTVDLTYSINGVETTENITDLNLASFESTMVNVGDLDIASPTQYDITYTLSNPNGNADADEANNSASGPVNGMTSIPVRVAVGEEGTGTWCGWCPRGHVFMEQMHDDYSSDEFIGIAVHNGDIMTISEYDSNIGFSGYPNAHMNRERRAIDPSALEANMDIRDEINPFDANIEVTYDEATREVTMVATATPRTDINSGDFRMSIVMTEDHVVGTTAAYNQANYYSGGTTIMGGYEGWADPVPAADMEYHDVARALVTSYQGDMITTPLAADASFTNTYTYTIPESMDPTQMQAIVLITDNETEAILNADEDIVQMPVSIFETPEILEAAIYPNPATDIATIVINLEEASEVNVTVIDLAGKMMSNTRYGKAQGEMAYQVNVSDLNAGIYLVKIDTENGIVTKRLTVSK